MNPTLFKIGHWVLNILLVAACIGLIFLSLFGQPGAGSNAHFTRFMTMLTGVAFGVIAYFLIKKTLKSG